MRLQAAGLMSNRQNDLFGSLLGWLGVRLQVEFDMAGANKGTDGPVADRVVYQCGLPAGRQLDRFEPLVAPVGSAARYQGLPVYFSEVVVRADHPAKLVSDLAGTRFAYNQEGSFSGWVAPRHGLEQLLISPDSMTWTRTGSHRASIDAVIDRTADAAAIDSMILDLEAPTGLRTIASFGPWPAPPISASLELDSEFRQKMKAAWSEMHLDREGGRILEKWPIDRLAAVESARYEDLPRVAARLFIQEGKFIE
jgi:phosphonate transport system substrate-binding protein